MACLGTSGRQGLFVAVGTRCYRNQKFLCQLFLQNSGNSNKIISNRQYVDGNDDGAFTDDDGAITISKLLLKRNNTSASALSYGSTSTSTSTSTLTRYPVQKRHFHLLTNTIVPVKAACSGNKDYSVMMNNSTIGGSNNNKSNNKSNNEINNNHNNYSKLNVNTKRKCCSNTKTNSRHYSSAHTQQPAGPMREMQIDPYIILEEDLKDVYDDIRERLFVGTTQPELKEIASYYFDGQGKAFRPMVVFLMAKAINYHLNKESSALLNKQRKLALFAEMAHSASLVHDDVIDQSNYRRGKPSVNVLWNHKKVTMAGDFILSLASIMIARLRNDDVTILCSKILTDLVQGEFMQLGSRETENERFAHYLTKTYRKTASLMANTLKATAVIAEADEHLTELAFQYGRNIGLAFQLVDDMLDYVSSTEMMGKPAAADLKLGLATAPVLFACEKYPELNPMIMRRFSEPGDVERAFELVHKSNGLEQTRFLARKHGIEAIRLAQEITESPYQKGLQVAADLVINRMK